MNVLYSHNVKIVGIVILAILVSMFFAKPKWENVQNSVNSPFMWQGKLEKKENLLNPMSHYHPMSHEAKQTFRLTIPFFMKIFNLDPIHLYIFQYILAFFIYLFWSILSYKIFQNYQLVLLSTCVMATTYFGRSFYVDSWGALDTYCYFLILLAMWGRKKVYILTPATIALFFVDERGIISFFTIWLSIKLFDTDRSSITWKQLVSLKDTSKYLIGVFIACMAVRMYLSLFHGMHTPSEGADISMAIEQWKSIQRGLFVGIIGVWGILFYSLYFSYIKKNYMFFFMIGFGILLFTGISVMVIDIYRSIAYIVPLVLLCFKLFSLYSHDVKPILIVILLINIMSPFYVIAGDGASGSYYYPVFFDILFKMKSMISI